eukprot:Amastigsp_a174867_84.p1 type:complete len:515 gc:universal Amastigsp_a174867_84:1679-135(-)
MSRPLVVAALFVFGALLAAAPVSAIPPQEYFCPECQILAADALSSLGTNATDAEIGAALAKLCALLPGSLKTDCAGDIETVLVALNSSDESIVVKYPPRGICAMLSICTLDCCAVPYTPEQVHLALTQDPTQMRVTWVTLEQTPNPMVLWGSAPGDYVANATGSSATYAKGGWLGWVHTAVMTGLAPNTRYYYRVGDPTIGAFWDSPNWSLVPELNFVTGPGTESAQYPLSVAVIGDLGATDASDRTLARINALVMANGIDLVMHSGDIAYSDGYETLFDAFGRKLELVAAYVPYMTAPGNHEGFWAFEGYLTRFPMPWEGVSPSPLFYAVSYGRVRVVAICTEGPDGLLALDLVPGGVQHQWLAAELAASSSSPDIDWIVAYMHRPLYCSSSADICGKQGGDFRAAIEGLLHTYHVDLVITAHRHNYERMYQIWNNTLVSSSYANPTAPVYVVNGVGGSKEGLDGFSTPTPDWSAVRLSEYGYALMTFNASALEWAYYSAASNELLDSFTITK